MSALEVEGLRVAVGDKSLVHGVSLAVTAGRPFTILGDTGSGKSLVAEAVMGILPRELRTSGKVTIDGKTYDAADAAARRGLWGRAIAMLPQEPWLSLDPTMRGSFQVEEVHTLVRGTSAATARKRAQAELARLGLGQAGRKFPFQLSGGMAQRLALAATHAGGAGILIADEPTKGLDAALCGEVVTLLRGEVERGAALITITHDIGVARGLGGEVAVMLDGRVVEHGPAEQVLVAPSHEYTRRLLAADPASWPERARTKGGEVVLAAEGLAKALGGRMLFEGLDISIHAGQSVAVTGPSGCGKTTLGNLLLGLMRPDAGRVARAPGKAAVAFQKIYQDPPAAFAPRVTLRTALKDVCQRHGIAWSKVEPLMARMRLAPALLDRLPDQVSGGELQRFALVRVLLLDPVFIFADEATSRLDPITQQDVMTLLREAVDERGFAMLLVTHDRALAAKVADRSFALDHESLRPARAAA